MAKGFGYETIGHDTRARILAETKAKLAARRSFLEGIVTAADAQMARLDRERLDHFLGKHCAAAELRDIAAAEVDLMEVS